MKIRWIRIALLGIALYFVPTWLGWWESAQTALQSNYPDLSRLYPQLENREDESSEFLPGPHPMRTITWTNRQGSMMGIVLAKTWSNKNRIYYEVSGPLSPDATKSEIPLEAIYRTSGGVRVEQYGVHSTENRWQAGLLVTGTALLPQGRYQTESTSGQFRVVFWTPLSEPVGNLVFRYREAGEVAWFSLDRQGVSDPYDPAQWTPLETFQGGQ
jgi:hypothetical protein